MIIKFSPCYKRKKENQTIISYTYYKTCLLTKKLVWVDKCFLFCYCCYLHWSLENKTLLCCCCLNYLRHSEMTIVYLLLYMYHCKLSIQPFYRILPRLMRVQWLLTVSYMRRWKWVQSLSSVIPTSMAKSPYTRTPLYLALSLTQR